MDNLTELKKLWMTADVKSLPKASEVLRTLRRYRMRQAAKNIGSLMLALILVAVMIWTVVVYRSEMLSTRLGEACFFLAILIVIVLNWAALRRLSTYSTGNNIDFIRYLKKERLRQISFYKKTQVIGFAIASASLLLYIFEFLQSHPGYLVPGYTLAILWISICWFFLRPWAMKRRLRKLEETIAQLEKLSNQLNRA